MINLVAKVIVDIKHDKVNQLYDYLIKPSDQAYIQKGMRVIVPFTDNNLDRLGYVVDVVEQSDLATKYVKEVLDVEPIFDDEVFMMVNQLLEIPGTLISKVFETVISNDMLVHYQKKVTLLNPRLLPETLKEKFNRSNEWILTKSDTIKYTNLKTLHEKGVIRLETILKPRLKKPVVPYVVLSDLSFVGTAKQNEIINYLKSKETVLKKELIEISSASIVNTLIKRGVIEVVLKDIRKVNENDSDARQLKELPEALDVHLKAFQQHLNQHQTILLQGKNDVSDLLRYHLIESILKTKKQVLILVPERFLISKYQKVFADIFPDELVTTISSDQTFKERYLTNQAILDGTSNMVVGARSAVFTSFADLGAIIVIDSHDQSYVAHEGIYYDAIQIASLRAKYHKIPLILETHTKTLEHVHLINQKKILNIDLSMYHQKVAETFVVDMKEELKTGNTKMISSLLKEKVDEAISANEKVLLIMNQKGYAPFVMCRSCSYVPTDPSTGIPLNYIERQQILRSNLTKYQEPFHQTCPKCGKPSVKAVGSGIEQLENYLHKLYPNETTIRIDSDTITNKSFYQLVDSLDQNPEIKIIIGTQMALKSVLSKKVSLVGVLMADSWLKLPRYDANSLGFQALSDAKFMAKDTLVIQSYQSSHFVIEAISDDIDSFYKKELSNRKLAKLPPYVHMLQILIEARSYLGAHQYGFMLKEQAVIHGITVLGPVDASLLKQNDRYRVLLLLKYQTLPADFMKYLRAQDEINIYASPTVSWY